MLPTATSIPQDWDTQSLENLAVAITDEIIARLRKFSGGMTIEFPAILINHIFAELPLDWKSRAQFIPLTGNPDQTLVLLPRPQPKAVVMSWLMEHLTKRAPAILYAREANALTAVIKETGSVYRFEISIDLSRVKKINKR